MKTYSARPADIDKKFEANITYSLLNHRENFLVRIFFSHITDKITFLEGAN